MSLRPHADPARRFAGGQRWLLVLLGLGALAAGIVVAAWFGVGDGGGSDRDRAPATGISMPAGLADAEDAALALLSAAGDGDCDAVNQLATARLAGELTKKINCANPERSDIEVVDSVIVDDDPVTVSATLEQRGDTLQVEIEMIDVDGTWLANNFDAVL